MESMPDVEVCVAEITIFDCEYVMTFLYFLMLIIAQLSIKLVLQLAFF